MKEIAIILIIIITIAFLHFYRPIVGGSDELLKHGFNPVFKYYDVITETDKTHIFQYDRYTRVNQVKTVAKKGSIGDYARLLELLGKFIKVPKQKLEALTTLSDAEIKTKVSKRLKQNEEDDPDSPYTLDSIKQFMINKRIKGIKMNYLLKYPVVENYLDIGCGEGIVTRSVGKVIEAKNIHGCDITDYKPKGIIFKLVEDGKPLPYPDAYFEFVTIFNVMHHIKNIDNFMKELRRITKPFAVVMVIDHIITNDMDAMLIDIEHWLWQVTGNTMEGSYKIERYLNHKIVDDLFIKQANFYPILSNRMFYNLIEDITVTKSFWTYFLRGADDQRPQFLYGRIDMVRDVIGLPPELPKKIDNLKKNDNPAELDKLRDKRYYSQNNNAATIAK